MKKFEDYAENERIYIDNFNVDELEPSNYDAILACKVLIDNFDFFKILKLQNLECLDLSYCSINSLSSEIGKLQNLQSLDLSHNELFTLPKEIKELVNLQYLDLSSNHLKEFPKEIKELVNLQYLDLSVNELTELPQEIGLHNLQHLDLDFNIFTKLPLGVCKLLKLDSLSLNNNKISKLPNEIENLINLKWLSLHDNEFIIFPTNLIKIEHLVLSHNEILALPNEIVNFKNLASLNLSENKITNILTEIGELKNLISLDLSKNKVTSLPKEIGQLKNLISLDLSGNKITALPKEIGLIEKLNSLNLDSNIITVLPEEIGNLKEIEILSLGGNKLSKLPNSFSNLTNLTNLYLEVNNFRTFPLELLMLTNLKTLDVGYNKILYLPNNIGIFTNLQYFYLYNNPLQAFPISFGKLRLLRTLFHPSFYKINAEEAINLGDVMGSIFPLNATPELRDMGLTQMLDYLREKGEEEEKGKAYHTFWFMPNALRGDFQSFLSRFPSFVSLFNKAEQNIDISDCFKVEAINQSLKLTFFEKQGGLTIQEIDELLTRYMRFVENNEPTIPTAQTQLMQLLMQPQITALNDEIDNLKRDILYYKGQHETTAKLLELTQQGIVSEKNLFNSHIETLKAQLAEKQEIIIKFFAKEEQLNYLIADAQRDRLPLSTSITIQNNIERKELTSPQNAVFSADNLLIDLIDTAKKIIEKPIFYLHQDTDENAITEYFIQFLKEQKYLAFGQQLKGTSPTGKKSGELDIDIQNEKGITLSIVEAFILNTYSSNVIKDHLTKLVNTYDKQGLPITFLLIYAKNADFIGLWDKYKNYINTVIGDDSIKKPLLSFDELPQDVSEIKVGCSTHQNNLKIYHIFINMYNDKPKN